jgi:hypothetical protein
MRRNGEVPHIGEPPGNVADMVIDAEDLLNDDHTRPVGLAGVDDVGLHRPVGGRQDCGDHLLLRSGEADRTACSGRRVSVRVRARTR